MSQWVSSGLRSLYFFAFDVVTASFAAPFFAKWLKIRPERLAGFRKQSELQFSSQSGVQSGGDIVSHDRTVGFHASSVGELEMLRPLIELALEQGARVVVTAFSDSASDALAQLKKGREHRVIAQLSPRESEWLSFFRAHSVQTLWMAKYDFWPGLLWAASELRIPIHVINAQLRPSLKRLPAFSAAFGIKNLEFIFHVVTETSKNSLQNWCRQHPQLKSQVISSLDPRRVQIRRRTESITARAEKIRSELLRLPSPRVIVGSAWPGDLMQLQTLWSDPSLRPGTLIVFPHSFEKELLSKMKQITQNFDPSIRVEWVEEKGVLLECYSAADWIWVGGGFDHGVHSTLEPAVTGRAIGIGPKNATQFEEIAELQERGLLTICSTPRALAQWWRQAQAAYRARTEAPRSVSFPTESEFRSHFEPFLAPR